MMDMRRGLALFCLLTTLGFGVQATGQELGFTGFLTDVEQVPIDGSVELQFELFTQEVGGGALWSETQQAQVSEGRLNAKLGRNTALPEDPRHFRFSVPQYSITSMKSAPVVR